MLGSNGEIFQTELSTGRRKIRIGQTQDTHGLHSFKWGDHMKKDFTNTYKIRMRDGSLVDWDTLSDEQKQEIGIQLNRQAMLAVGFKEVKPGETA